MRSRDSGVVKKKEALNFRVSADFKRKLIDEAKKDRRSLTNYLETTLTKLWEQQERQETPVPCKCHAGEVDAGTASEVQKGQSRLFVQKRWLTNAF